MSTTAPAASHQTCSCDRDSESKTLKKRVEQLLEENDELKRDKRSFRDASDESRRTLARLREDVKELRKKLECEREEKENALGEVKRVQAEVSKAAGPSEDTKAHTVPSGPARVQERPAPDAYPSPVEPTDDGEHGCVETADGLSAKALGRKKAVKGAALSHKMGNSDSSMSTAGEEGSFGIYASASASGGALDRRREHEVKPEVDQSSQRPLGVLGKRRPADDESPYQNKKVKIQPSEPQVPSQNDTSLPTAAARVKKEHSPSPKLSSLADVVLETRLRPNDSRVQCTKAARDVRQPISSSAARETLPNTKPPSTYSATRSGEIRPDTSVESKEQREGATAKPRDLTVRFGGHSIGPHVDEAGGRMKEGPTRVPFPLTRSSKPIPATNNDLRLPPRPAPAPGPPPKRGPMPPATRPVRSPEVRPPSRTVPPSVQALPPRTAQAYFAIPNVRLPPSHMHDLGDYEYEPSRSRREGSYAHGGRP